MFFHILINLFCGSDVGVGVECISTEAAVLGSILGVAVIFLLRLFSFPVALSFYSPRLPLFPAQLAKSTHKIFLTFLSPCLPVSLSFFLSLSLFFFLFLSLSFSFSLSFHFLSLSLFFFFFLSSSS